MRKIEAVNMLFSGPLAAIFMLRPLYTVFCFVAVYDTLKESYVRTQVTFWNLNVLPNVGKSLSSTPKNGRVLIPSD
jgi:hypothetical protein